MANKHLLYGAAVAVAAVGATQVIKYNSLRKNLDIQVVPVPHKASLQGIELRLDVTVKNPTDHSLIIKHPQVTLIHKGETFMSSEVSDKTYNIEKTSQVKFAPIVFKLSYLNLVTQFPALVAEMRKGGKLNLTALIHTKMERFITLNREVPMVVDLSKIIKL